MRLARQRGQRGGDLGEAGAYVGRRGASLAAAVGVADVGAGDGVPEIPLDPRQGRVTDPAAADLLSTDPGVWGSRTRPLVLTWISMRLARIR